MKHYNANNPPLVADSEITDGICDALLLTADKRPDRPKYPKNWM